MTPEEQALIEAAKAYYWDTSLERHNDLLDAVFALLESQSPEDPTDSEVHI